MKEGLGRPNFAHSPWPRRVRRMGFQRVKAGALDARAVLRAWLRRKFFGGNHLDKTPLEISKRLGKTVNFA